jgi:hypothetical protein
MLKNRRKNPNIHLNVLQQSDAGAILMVGCLEERFLTTIRWWQQLRGEDLAPPAELDGDMHRWRTCKERHMRGDFRHTEDEWNSMKRLADWTMKIKAELFHEPYVPMDCLQA